MSIGKALRRLREKNGYTQAQIAEKVGIKRTTYISYENSKTVPSYDLVEKFAEIYGVTIQDFDNETKSRTNLEISSTVPSYQFTVEEKMAELTSEERMVIKYIRLLTSEERTDFFNEIKSSYLDRRFKDDLNNS
ncbi:MAG: helix-turn-helix transcriptional regulator [Clostridia bacterium]|nr:helix-turn-helix transcriptional regulator [Clostridia bacterium]